jgi:LuxR family maltose regulon positive regulatory protein
LKRLRDSRDPSDAQLAPYLDTILAAFPPKNADSVATLARPAKSGAATALTSRELQVLTLIAQGKSNQEIANALVVTLSAIKKHTGIIFGKLHVNNRTEAVARARELGIL